LGFIYRTMNPKANIFGFFLYPVLSSSICVDFPFGFCEKEIAMKKHFKRIAGNARFPLPLWLSPHSP